MPASDATRHDTLRSLSQFFGSPLSMGRGHKRPARGRDVPCHFVTAPDAVGQAHQMQQEVYIERAADRRDVGAHSPVLATPPAHAALPWARRPPAPRAPTSHVTRHVTSRRGASRPARVSVTGQSGRHGAPARGTGLPHGCGRSAGLEVSPIVRRVTSSRAHRPLCLVRRIVQVIVE